MMHNKIVVDFINYHYTTNKAAKIDNVPDYMERKYGVDIIHSPYYLFGSVHAGSTRNAKKAVGGFDSFAFLVQQRNNLDNHFYKKLYSFMKHTQYLRGGSERILAVVHDFELGIGLDKKFSAQEKNDFLIMLHVFRSSLRLWTYVKKNNIISKQAYLPSVLQEDISDDREPTIGVADSLWWKVVAADYVGGIAGGILGGGVGAVVGLAANSAISVIDKWGSQSSGGCNFMGPVCPSWVANEDCTWGWDTNFPSGELTGDEEDFYEEDFQ